MDRGYPRELIRIGDHVRKERLDRGLLQKEVALLIGVDENTIMNWELGHCQPALRTIPGIIEFLGYVPFELGESLMERLRSYRRVHGISRQKLAGMLGVDEATLLRWEMGQRRPGRQHTEWIKDVIVRGCRKVQG